MINLMEKFNKLMASLKDTSADIDKKLKGFIGKISGAESKIGRASCRERVSSPV